MFFGGGRKNKNKPISADKSVVLNYRYAHIMFVFTLAFGFKYIIATRSSDGWHYKNAPKDEIIRLYGVTALPELNFWQRFSLPAAFVVILTGIILFSMTQS